MTIHTEHPFADPPERRDPLRRFRGRMPAPVTVWTRGTGRGRVGLTVSSVLVADGEPSRVLGLVDEDAAFWTGAFEKGSPTVFAISLLAQGHGPLAEAFAGSTPAPGGPFTLGTWHDTDWGPVLADAAGWLGVRRDPPSALPRHAGWSILVEGVVEHAEAGEADPLTHVRGRYR